MKAANPIAVDVINDELLSWSLLFILNSPSSCTCPSNLGNTHRWRGCCCCSRTTLSSTMQFELWFVVPMVTVPRMLLYYREWIHRRQPVKCGHARGTCKSIACSLNKRWGKEKLPKVTSAVVHRHLMWFCDESFKRVNCLLLVTGVPRVKGKLFHSSYAGLDDPESNRTTSMTKTGLDRRRRRETILG